MNSPNHIIGGVAITGISLSFWDINIFSNSFYLGTCIFASLLPDIDHTKSIIGKVFFPLAKFLDVRFGHRTLTHSLTSLIPLTLLVLFLELNILNPYFNLVGANYSLIFFFAYLSHLILDMLTVSGIPLFYPFLKNPCVIPANPNLRFRSGDIKSESLAFLLFTMVIFSSYDLFKNGFWTSYNRSFGTLKHVFREFKQSIHFLEVEYKYTFNGSKINGKGYLIDAQKDVAEILQDNRIIIIDGKDTRFKNIEVKPVKTNYLYKVKDFNFNSLSIQQLNDSLKNKIVSGKVSANFEFKTNAKEFGKSVEFYKAFSPVFYEIENDSLHNKINSKIQIKRAKLSDIYKANSVKKNEFKQLKKLLEQTKNNLKNATDIYLKNKFQEEIINLTKKVNSFNLEMQNTSVLEREIYLLNQEKQSKKAIRFFGNLKVYEKPKSEILLSYN